MAKFDLKNEFSRLTKPKKVVLIASLLSALSCLMPWYHDLSVYGVADTYLGVTGPLFLAGWFIFVLSGALALMIGLPMMGKDFPKLPVKNSLATIIVGIQSLFLVLIANSVFYHQKFGVSITHKEPGFGMTIALLSIISIIASGYFWYKEENAFKGFDETLGRKEPLIRIPEPEVRQHVSVSRPAATEQPIKEAPKTSALRGFGYKEAKKGETLADLLKKNKEELPAEVAPEPLTAKTNRTEPSGKIENMRIRMDL